jgi:protein gp37
VFVNSMSDLFQKGVPESYVRLVFEVMNLADWHIYQVLTKRADRLRALTNRMPPSVAARDHIWLGVSVEDRKYGLLGLTRLGGHPRRGDNAKRSQSRSGPTEEAEAPKFHTGVQG